MHLACRSDVCSVVLKQGSVPRVARLALQLAPDADMHAFATAVTAKGIPVSLQTDTGPDTPLTLTVTDPSGLKVDLLAARALQAERPGQHGVRPRKLGHTAFFTSDIQAMVRFYTEVLGFRVSDWIADFFVFLRCNPDHHTVKFASRPGCGLHHIAFELNDWNHIKEACDLLAAHDLALFWGPGRHGPGHNIFTYHLNPDGFSVEMFTELDRMSSEESGCFDPRPWHKDRPQRPKVWIGGGPHPQCLEPVASRAAETHRAVSLAVRGKTIF